MWIKRTSLNSVIYFRIFSALMISLLLAGALFTSIIEFSKLHNKNMISSQINEIEKITSNIQEEILKENLTFAMTKEKKKNLQNNYFKTILIPEYELVLEGEEVKWSEKTLSIDNLRAIEFGDINGYLYFRAVTGETFLRINFLLSSIAALALFILLSLKLLSPILEYIKTIEKGIDVIGGGNLLYKIPIVGDNELSKLATGINNMGEKLYINIEKERKIERGQRSLITNISHDLRTPLTSIIGYMDLAKSELNKDDNIYRYIDVTMKNGLQLEKHINNLFLYSKILSDDIIFNLVKIDLNLMISQILELRSFNFSFTPCSEKIYINIDPEKFHRLIDNLITNAEKHGEKEKVVTIKVSKENGVANIRIKNYTEEDLKDKINFLTNRLYVASDDPSKNSTGLGLSIARELSEKMKGQLKLNYEDHVFTATLKFKTV